ncbi:hypothetical protein FE576_20425, partial [Clostridioides difficile]|nr:hypothetical protein [Clostridioides difficile]
LFFCFVWFYHGLVPKIIHLHPQELKMTASLLNHADQLVMWIGVAEILFAFCWLYPRGKRWLFGMQIIVVPLLTIAAIVADPTSVQAPFNPL